MLTPDEIAQILEVFPDAFESDINISGFIETPYLGKNHTQNLNQPKKDGVIDETVDRRHNLSLVDPVWETIDPSPDVRAMFADFDRTFFSGTLVAVEVRWSPRMTLCAGLCCFEGKNGLCSIRLSEPLLKLRPRKDLVETLLDREGHGPNFQAHMKRINAAAGTNITVYHTFRDEVDSYHTHWWQCTGPCRNRPPFFGYVKRSMNRKPGPNDNWWGQHQANCTGYFVKIKEPEKKVTKKGKLSTDPVCGTTAKRKKAVEASRAGSADIRRFAKAVVGGMPGASEEKQHLQDSIDLQISETGPFSSQTASTSSHRWPGHGYVLGGSLPSSQSRLLAMATASSTVDRVTVEEDIPGCIPTVPIAVGDTNCRDRRAAPQSSTSTTVTCPACGMSGLSMTEINLHLDECMEIT